jgi:flagellar basal-body rod protein FlgB
MGMLQPRAVLFDLISGRASWLSQRQAVLSQNVANADTPDYRPRDLVPATFAQLVRREEIAARRIEPARTSPMHAAGRPVQAGPFRDERAESYETAPAGNAVVLPEQLQKMASTELDHQLTTTLHRRYIGMLRTALGVPQG